MNTFTIIIETEAILSTIVMLAGALFLIIFMSWICWHCSMDLGVGKRGFRFECPYCKGREYEFKYENNRKMYTCRNCGKRLRRKRSYAR